MHGSSAQGVEVPPRRAIVYCINYAPEMIGVGRYAGELGRHLEAAGVRLEVVTTPPHYPGWIVKAPFRNRYHSEGRGAVRVIRCPLWLKPSMRGVARMLAPLSFAASSGPVIVARALSFRPDVILATEPGVFTAPAAILAAKLCGARLVLHVQDLEVEAAFAVSHLKGAWLLKLAMAIHRLILRGFDHVVTISNQMRRNLLRGGGRPDRVSVIRNWVDLSAIGPLDGPNAFRTELGIPVTTKVVLYAGSIGAKQALDLVVGAAERLAGRRDILFVIAGEGPEKDRLVQHAGDNVRFLPLQPEHRLRELLALADLHILPQHSGAGDLVLPSKLGGMLASGRPILVQAAPGTELAEFLEGAAQRVAPGDAAALAEAIATLEPDTAARAERRHRLASELSHEAALRRFEAVLFPDWLPAGSVTMSYEPPYSAALQGRA